MLITAGESRALEVQATPYIAWRDVEICHAVASRRVGVQVFLRRWVPSGTIDLGLAHAHGGAAFRVAEAFHAPPTADHLPRALLKTRQYHQTP